VRTQTLAADIAHLLHRIVFDKKRFDVPDFPPVVGGHWGDISLEGLWGPLRTEGPTLVWEPSLRYPAAQPAKANLERLRMLRNAPARLELADGRQIVSRLGDTPKWGARGATGPGPTCEFVEWTTEGGRPVVRWVARLKGGGLPDGNLHLFAGSRFSARNLRLEGAHTWYLLEVDPKEDLVVVVDGGPTPFDAHALGIDFTALQVALGTPLRLDVLVGFDGPGNVVGAAGVDLGGNRETKRRRRIDGPVPDDRDESWVSVFFHRLATAMARASELPWGVACNAYLDSDSDPTIDGQYLKLQVALEAFANALLKQAERKTKAEPRLLVKSRDAWVAWVQEHADELRKMVADSAKQDVFVNKVRSAMNLPSSGVVADALSRLDPPLIVDEMVLDEVERRNIPAHHATMNKPGEDYDIDRDVERVDVLRSLLVALIARACRYDGPIAGWVTTDAVNWKPQPGWWAAPSSETLAEAREAFVAGEQERFPPTRPKRFQSRLSRKPSRRR